MRFDAFLLTAVLASVIVRPALAAGDPATNPPQVPLCMIGDSITWAGDGDYWRQDLLELLPNLGFVGTHSAVLGYSHAGEGGNSTSAVLARLEQIPDCPYYHLLIGTNDGSGKTPEEQEKIATGTAERIVKIVNGLLAKPSVQKVFLASILPCETDNPFRDITNSRVNAMLRPKVGELWPDGRVVWVEYETPIRALPNWGPMIRLHPTKEGYKVVARITADAIRKTLNLPETIAAPQPLPGCGVRVTNLWQGEVDGTTTAPIIAGWYTCSFDVTEVADGGGKLSVSSENANPKLCLNKSFTVPATAKGQRLTWNFFTEYAGYGYATSLLKLRAEGCAVGRILLEKRRPSGQASVYGTGSYLDTTSPIALGELVARP